MHTPSTALADALAKADRALAELRVEGVATNAAFLQAVLAAPARSSPGEATTRFVDEHVAELVAAAAAQDGRCSWRGADRRTGGAPRLAGVKVDDVDPLAVLDFGTSAAARPRMPRGDRAATADEQDGPAGTVAVRVAAAGHGRRRSTSPTATPSPPASSSLVMEAMKMEHVVVADRAGLRAPRRRRRR